MTRAVASNAGVSSEVDGLTAVRVEPLEVMSVGYCWVPHVDEHILSVPAVHAQVNPILIWSWDHHIFAKICSYFEFVK